MKSTDWIMIGLALVGYLIGGIVAFIKLNIKNTENYKDIVALSKAFEDHKNDIRDDIREVKDNIRTNHSDITNRFDELHKYLIKKK